MYTACKICPLIAVVRLAATLQAALLEHNRCLSSDTAEQRELEYPVIFIFCLFYLPYFLRYFTRVIC